MMNNQRLTRIDRRQGINLSRRLIAIEGNQAILQPDNVLEERGDNIGALDRAGSEISVTAGYLDAYDLTTNRADVAVCGIYENTLVSLD